MSKHVEAASPVDADRAWAARAVWDIVEAACHSEAELRTAVRCALKEGRPSRRPRRTQLLAEQLALAVKGCLEVTAHLAGRDLGEVLGQLRATAEAEIQRLARS